MFFMLELSEQDIEAIEQIHQLWIETDLHGDRLDLLQFCTEDVKWMIPCSPVLVGKEAVKPFLLDKSVKNLDTKTEKIEIRGSGKVAYKTSNFATRFVVDGTEQEQFATGTHLWILHKNDSGMWQVALVTWQSSTGKMK